MTTAEDIMTRNPEVCSEEDPIIRAVALMRDFNTGVVPIVDENDCCVGIVTDRDLCLDVILQELDAKTTPLSQVMHTDLLTCLPEHLLEDVIDRMARRQVKRILVVDLDGRCMGIISETDFVSQTDPLTVGRLFSSVYS